MQLENNRNQVEFDSSADVIFDSVWISNLYNILQEKENCHIYISEKENRSLYIHTLDQEDILHYGLFVKINKWTLINKLIKYKDLIWEDAPFFSMITAVYIERKFKVFVENYVYHPLVVDYFSRVQKPLKNHIYLKTGIWNITESRFKLYKEAMFYNFIKSKTNYDIKKFDFNQTPIFKKILTTWFGTIDLKNRKLEVFLAALSLIYYNKFIETKSILIVQGISGAGKSLLSKLIQALIGIEHVASTNVSSLTQNQFSKSMLANKKGIILNDANQIISLDSQELLKGLSGSDSYNYEIKFENERKLIIWTGFILIVSNNTIEFSEHVGDLPDRKLTFNFNKKLDLKEFEIGEPVLSVNVSELSNGKTFYNFTGALEKEIPYIAGLLVENFNEKKNKNLIKNYKDYLIKYKVNDNNILENFIKNYIIFSQGKKLQFGTARPTFIFDENNLNFHKVVKDDEGREIKTPEVIGIYTLYCIHCFNQNIKVTITRNKFKDLLSTFIDQEKDYSKMKITRDYRGYFTLHNAAYRNVDELKLQVKDVEFNEFTSPKQEIKEEVVVIEEKKDIVEENNINLKIDENKLILIEKQEREEKIKILLEDCLRVQKMANKAIIGSKDIEEKRKLMSQLEKSKQDENAIREVVKSLKIRYKVKQNLDFII